MGSVLFPEFFSEFFTEKIYKEVCKIKLSGPTKGSKYIRAEITPGPTGYQAALYTQKQVFHENIPPTALKEYTEKLLQTQFTHCNAWDGTYHYTARVTKKGKILTHRTKDNTPPKLVKSPEKNHLLKEGMDIPVLVDMGVFTQEGKIAAAKRDKFTQINRFLELLADETKDLTPATPFNIIDFGCGKSYLTFLVYHYFAIIRGLTVQICGMDTDKMLIEKCNAAAKKYHYKGLHFITGDIGSQEKPPLEGWGQGDAFHAVISLHACDTATDYTLYNAVRWGADLICAVPCCQHELRSQMQPGILPLFSRYGIIQERTAALATDAIRAALLESEGYRVQVIELTDRENTAKNLMLRGRKVNRVNFTAHENTALALADQMTAAFGFRPTLGKLLRG